MKLLVAVAGIFVSVAMLGNAMAQTKSEQCAAYAREAARQSPTTTGAARGAARGAIGGAIVGEAGRGAAAGAVVGGARRVAQKSRSYQYYYDQCMSR